MSISWYCVWQKCVTIIYLIYLLVLIRTVYFKFYILSAYFVYKKFAKESFKIFTQSLFHLWRSLCVSVLQTPDSEFVFQQAFKNYFSYLTSIWEKIYQYLYLQYVRTILHHESIKLRVIKLPDLGTHIYHFFAWNKSV